MLRIEEALTAGAIFQARSLFEEYAASLGIDLCFQDFEDELKGLPGDYARPHGRLLLARWKDEIAGCVALRRIEPEVCEMKRLYVRPEYRSRGVGRSLATEMIGQARQAGYRWMRLDSLPSMQGALTLYRRLGFREIPPYRANPVEGAVFLQLQLENETADT